MINFELKPLYLHRQVKDLSSVKTSITNDAKAFSTLTITGKFTLANVRLWLVKLFPEFDSDLEEANEIYYT